MNSADMAHGKNGRKIHAGSHKISSRLIYMVYHYHDATYVLIIFNYTYIDDYAYGLKTEPAFWKFF